MEDEIKWERKRNKKKKMGGPSFTSHPPFTNWVDSVWSSWVGQTWVNSQKKISKIHVFLKGFYDKSSKFKIKYLPITFKAVKFTMNF